MTAKNDEDCGCGIGAIIHIMTTSRQFL